MSAFTTHCCTIAMLSGVARWEGHPAPILSAEVLACVLVETPAHDDLGKGQWKSYLLHTHNISSSVTIFLHILLRQILLSPFDIRKLRLKDAKRFNQCLLCGGDKTGVQNQLPPKCVSPTLCTHAAFWGEGRTVDGKRSSE